jgi:hypothetical protein
MADVQMPPDFDCNDVDHLITMAMLFIGIDEWDKAKAFVLRALGLKPDDANSHMALAQILLSQGEFSAGWREYEHRLGLETTTPVFTSVHWNGMHLPTGRLFLIGDQGYGDVILFSRYIKMAAERVQDVVLGSSLELKMLLKNLPEIAQYTHTWNDTPGHAVYCRLSSLPGIFNTTLDTIPNHVPYIWANPGRAMAWRDRLPKGLKVGLCWSGRDALPNGVRRSISLVELLPVTKMIDATFVSLQKQLPESDAEDMKDSGILDVSNSLTDFAETAALIENLDLVITIDTAVAHLAGAMGKPVWIMLAKPACWRWMINRDDSPWYPTARLFRQDTRDDWNPVMAHVGVELSRLT